MKNIDRLVYIFYKSTEKYCKDDFISFVKFRYLLENSFKNEIQSQIMNDIKNSNIVISDDDICLLVNNIYVQCCLEAYEVDIDIIVNQIMLRTRAYNNFQKSETRESTNFFAESQLCKQILQKYSKIIKEKINKLA